MGLDTFVNQKPINVINCIKAVDGEVRVPRVDSLKRHVLKRFQKVNSFKSSHSERPFRKSFNTLSKHR